jgi:hypothetical protein
MSKFYRLKMVDNIRDLILGVPFRNLKEITVKEQIYRACGEIQTGSTYQPVDIRIWLQNGDPILEIKSDSAKIYALCPFKTESDQEEARNSVNDLLMKWWN